MDKAMHKLYWRFFGIILRVPITNSFLLENCERTLFTSTSGILVEQVVLLKKKVLSNFVKEMTEFGMTNSRS